MINTKLIELQIEVLKQKLIDSDHIELKYLRGDITLEEWEPFKQIRADWRKAINELEVEL